MQRCRDLTHSCLACSSALAWPRWNISGAVCTGTPVSPRVQHNCEGRTPAHRRCRRSTQSLVLPATVPYSPLLLGRDAARSQQGCPAHSLPRLAPRGQPLEQRGQCRQSHGQRPSERSETGGCGRYAATPLPHRLPSVLPHRERTTNSAHCIALHDKNVDKNCGFRSSDIALRVRDAITFAASPAQASPTGLPSSAELRAPMKMQSCLGGGSLQVLLCLESDFYLTCARCGVGSCPCRIQCRCACFCTVSCPNAPHPTRHDRAQRLRGAGIRSGGRALIFGAAGPPLPLPSLAAAGPVADSAEGALAVTLAKTGNGAGWRLQQAAHPIRIQPITPGRALERPLQPCSWVWGCRRFHPP
ncbi:hypothetical protein HaLaN_13010 [Haematococcus lacustris]|uniref:Uncharacterized protein n=1 Tax=Haematococcus lacustris TaxID=44745 RepID=A0A699ZBZ5_HAELA|nr:hypothetical protein HaLaN_13010 [Haematococcus lacustris]